MVIGTWHPDASRLRPSSARSYSIRVERALTSGCFEQEEKREEGVEEASGGARAASRLCGAADACVHAADVGWLSARGAGR